MYYNEICKTISESNEKTFVCEMINGSVKEMDLKVQPDDYAPVPVYVESGWVLPWYIARDIISITPKNKYKA